MLLVVVCGQQPEKICLDWNTNANTPTALLLGKVLEYRQAKQVQWLVIEEIYSCVMAAFNKKRVQEFLYGEWQWQLRDNPEYASQVGQHEYDNSLQDLSPTAFEQRIEHNAGVMAGLEELLAHKDNFSDLERLHLEFIVKSIEDEQRAFQLGCHLYPVNSIGYGGVHNNFIEALDWLGETNKAENFMSRLARFPQQCAEYQALLRRGMSEGQIASSAMVRKVPEQIQNIISALQENKGPICDLISSTGLDGSAKAMEHKTAAAAALQNLKVFFEVEYIPAARTTCGAKGLPRGDEVYSHCLKYHTTTTMSPDEVHALGLREVARIEERYQRDVLDALSYEGSFEQFVEKCKSDQTQYYKRESDILDAYRISCNYITAKLGKYFSRLPVAEVEITSLDSSSAPAAYYMQGTADGSRPGRFYVNVSNLHQRPIYEMVALALHEAVPGHHLQMALALENDTIPAFLRFTEDRRYEYCPARRNMYTAYLEGWALYCEALGEEMGVYASPMSIFGRLSMEMMRAVRLVVDTGIHHLGWSMEQAILYMMEKTGGGVVKLWAFSPLIVDFVAGMHRHEVEAECYRYEAWPGQACAYKVGEVAIWRMRRHAEVELGTAFDLRAFHDCLLDSGPMPLDTLEEKVKVWIASIKTA